VHAAAQNQEPGANIQQQQQQQQRRQQRSELHLSGS